MKSLFRFILELGMTPLVEVHDKRELHRILALHPPLLGINNRNLKSFSVDLETSFKLKTEIPASIPVISESGISTADDISRLKENGFAGALVGEAFLRKQDVEGAVRKILGTTSERP